MNDTYPRAPSRDSRGLLQDVKRAGVRTLSQAFIWAFSADGVQGITSKEPYFDMLTHPACTEGSVQQELQLGINAVNSGGPPCSRACETSPALSISESRRKQPSAFFSGVLRAEAFLRRSEGREQRIDDRLKPKSLGHIRAPCNGKTPSLHVLAVNSLHLLGVKNSLPPLPELRRCNLRAPGFT